MQLRALWLCGLITACSSSAAQDGDANSGSGGQTNGDGAAQSSVGDESTDGSGGSDDHNASGSGGALGHAGSNTSGTGGTSGSGGAAGTSDGGVGGAPDCMVPKGQGVTKVACVGDSITQGAGASMSKSYPSQLGVLLGIGYNVENFGVSSTTMLKNGDFSYWTHGKLTEAQASLPNVVVIALGTNDMDTNNYPRLSEYSADYGRMVDLFRGLASHPIVFAALPIWVKEDNVGNGYTNARLNQVIALIQGVAAAKSVCTIDLNSPFKNHGELYSDTIHPNDAGYGLIAKAVCQAIGGGCQ